MVITSEIVVTGALVFGAALGYCAGRVTRRHRALRAVDIENGAQALCLHVGGRPDIEWRHYRASTKEHYRRMAAAALAGALWPK